MKIPSIFSKVPSNRKFGFTPRHYDPKEEERKERELRIQKELMSEEERRNKEDDETHGYRTRIAGSFKTAKKTGAAQSDPSTSMLRLIIALIIAVGLIAYLQYGRIALVGAALIFVPFYLYVKYRSFRR